MVQKITTWNICTMETYERLKMARESLGFSIGDMAKKLGMSFPGYRDNENGKRVPKSTIIEGFVQLGFDANWILTGEGSMRLGEKASSNQAVSDEVEVKTTVDEETLAGCLEILEEVCQEFKIYYKPAKKAKLVALLYELQLLEDAEHKRPDKAKVLKLVHFAA